MKFGRTMVVVAAFALNLAACDQQQDQSEISDEDVQGTAEMTQAIEEIAPDQMALLQDKRVLDDFAKTLDSEKTTHIQRVISPGGIEAWLVEEHAVPLIAVEVGFSGGARRDPEGKEGLAYLMSGLLDEGAGDLDAEAFQTRLEDLSIRLSFDAGLDGFYGSLRMLKEKRDDGFDLLRLALTKPRFDAEPVERIRSQILVRLKRDMTSPRTIAQRTWFEEEFGDHVYARPVRGTPETLPGITADDLRGFLGRALARNNLKISVVGDISAEVLGPLLDQTFGALPAKAAPENIPQAHIPVEGRLIVVERSQPQSIVFFGGPGILLDDPDFFPAFVMNYILGGGGFSSRLMEEVREKRGLAYGVSTSFNPYDYAGVFFGSVATENERIAKSLSVIKEEIARMRDGGVTDKELQDAKTYLTGSFPLRFDSNARIANQLVGYQMTGRGIDYIDTRNDKIEAVTRDDIARVAARLLNPDDLTFVVVGEPKGLEPDILKNAP